MIYCNNFSNPRIIRGDIRNQMPCCHIAKRQARLPTDSLPLPWVAFASDISSQPSLIPEPRDHIRLTWQAPPLFPCSPYFFFSSSSLLSGAFPVAKLRVPHWMIYQSNMSCWVMLLRLIYVTAFVHVTLSLWLGAILPWEGGCAAFGLKFQRFLWTYSAVKLCRDDS